jgi:threonyl-tRNA synthetase
MAQAVVELYKDVKLGIGPTIEDGFYYDFDLNHSFSPEDLEKIERKMMEIVKRDLPFKREEISRQEAIKLFKSLKAPYKVELLKEMEDEKVSIYRQGDFVDLCRGPHISSAGKVKHYKLLSVAGAYWRGDERRPMLQRIYGTAFDTKKALEDYLKRKEEALRRDHRKLGRELDLFSIQDELGPGLVIYHPYGAILRFIIEDFLKEEHKKRGYIFAISPHIMRADIWKTSGHYQMEYPMYFFEIEEAEYGIKPMNCPAHILIYKTQPRSYKVLPMRYFELGTVYRHERSGVLHGLLRVRGFTQDDAHIFCTPDQLEQEILNCLDFAFFSLKTFGFEDFEVALSTRPDKYVGTLESWEKAEGALKLALEHHKIKYKVDPGEGVFYGPKIDIKLKDALERLWQGPTIQVDFNLPERFDMVYYGADNAQHRPVMIHRTVLGSLERFIGALIEHYAGEFPLWLAPIQVVITSIADRHIPYAKKVEKRLLEADIRVEVDERRGTVPSKIRDAQLRKIPYTLVVGDKEEETETLAVRNRAGHDERSIKINDFIKRLQKERLER